MKFDKNKILTVVTADQVKVGQKGWFGDTPVELYAEVKMKEPSPITEIRENVLYPFETDGAITALFYPAPEPTYAERQAEWVKEHNLQVGTKVCITRDFGRDEEAGTTGHSGVAGTTGKVWGMGPHYIDVVYDQDRKVYTTPYYVLEVIKEPTYAERQAEWVEETGLKIGDKVKIVAKSTYEENGWQATWNPEMDNTIGEIVEVTRFYGVNGIRCNSSTGHWWYPYFVLEPMKETYRPFNNDEINDLVGKVVTNKYTGYNILVTEQVANIAVRVGDSDCTAKDLFHYFTLEGKPCGVREES